MERKNNKKIIDLSLHFDFIGNKLYHYEKRKTTPLRGGLWGFIVGPGATPLGAY